MRPKLCCRPVNKRKESQRDLMEGGAPPYHSRRQWPYPQLSYSLPFWKTNETNWPLAKRNSVGNIRFHCQRKTGNGRGHQSISPTSLKVFPALGLYTTRYCCGANVRQ
eukprot:GHVT01015913.1.p2 GENE.GHVT01015913.1~~GHVT01015913.1.p2  ORF type:complete len:108 (+),score=10.25 GHVT01015913.1:2816-3139(+)